MLNIKITSCGNCNNILNLLCEIDEKLKYYVSNEWNNISLLLNLDVNKSIIKSLIRYKKILQHKLYNPNYACDIDFNCVVSQIKIYLNK